MELIKSIDIYLNYVRIRMKTVKERMPLKLYEAGMWTLGSKYDNVATRSIAMLTMFAWVLANTSEDEYDWTLEKEVEFKLRFL